MRRIYLAVPALAAAAVATVTVAASAGSASKPTSFTVVERETSFTAVDNSPGAGDASRGEFQPGDRALGLSTLTRGGRTVGRSQFECAFVSSSRAECQGTWIFNGRGGVREGTIAGAGEANFAGPQPVVAITGGTRAYRTARGEIAQRPGSGETTQVTFKLAR